MLAFAPVHSLAAKSAAPEIAVETLKPGQFAWHPERASSGPLEVVVSLSQQMAYVYRGGTLIGASTVSSGKPGHDTPVGHFPILQKRAKHFSNKYDNAPMPFMQRLNWHGVALHGGAIPGYPASHGCVRLPHKFAQKLFAATTLGSSVYIMDAAPGSPKAALAMAKANYGGQGTQMASAAP
ncbi:MAG TPA: L,D-transpeptidase family protein [Allosphingosinicella sp.]|uniref:L,D-transpeptidase family protein n=1 Tax=Allosphingosinicella sp. TaxID=2823234 RepID=UPI002ED8EEB0